MMSNDGTPDLQQSEQELGEAWDVLGEKAIELLEAMTAFEAGDPANEAGIVTELMCREVGDKEFMAILICNPPRSVLVCLQAICAMLSEGAGQGRTPRSCVATLDSLVGRVYVTREWPPPGS